MEREPAIKKAMNVLDIISQSEEERRLYEDRRRALLDYNSNMDCAQEKGLELGIAQGIEKGMEKGKLEVAKNMLKNEYDLKTVSEISGINTDDLSKYK
jgi:predicted transposase/invertase (TIGR01784 family)